MIEQISQTQPQLIELINDEDRHNINTFEADAQNIAKHAFPSGVWPSDLYPWPLLRLRFAELLKGRGRLVDAMIQGIRGCLLLERRRGQAWVRNLFDILQLLARVLMLPEQDSPCRKPGSPTETQLWDILYGYLHELSLDTVKIFGPGAGYTQAIQAWYSDCMSSIDAPKPGTRAFARRFKRAQSKFLLWAGVDENKGIDLT